jgi:hypothetical protein
MASLLDIDLGEAIRDTFNDKSRKMGFTQFLGE